MARALSAFENKEIVGVLTARNKTPTEQFWAAKERMVEEAKILVHCLDGHSRSKMQFYLSLMYRYGLIEDNDLEEFSKELRKHLSRGFER